MSEFNYGGQAVLEGVMMRGAKAMAVAVRHPAGHIVVHEELLTAKIYTSQWGKLPFVRGLALLWDALGLGLRALMFSAEVAVEEEEDVDFDGPLAWGTIAFSLAFGIGLFFVVPLLLTHLVDPYINSPLVSNIVEGVIRILLLLGYITAIGFLPDIQRVFGYHGAEHKSINAYEDGAPLEVEAVQTYGTAHPRCGTGFLLVVMVVSILIFALLGRPPLLLRIASRLLFIPVIVGISYEFIRFSAARYPQNPLIRALISPSLALQSLTTREPDDSMVEVAILALNHVLVQEGLVEERVLEEISPEAGVVLA